MQIFSELNSLCLRIDYYIIATYAHCISQGEEDLSQYW